MDYVEFGFFTKQKLRIVNFLSICTKNINEEKVILLVEMFKFITNMLLYYMDLIKDILFILFLTNVTKGLQVYYEGSVMIILIIVLCGNEVHKLIFIQRIKQTLNFSKWKVLVTIMTFPFMPAILLYTIAKLSFTKKLMTKNLNATNEISLKIRDVNKILARMKRNENMLENWPQLTTIIIIIAIYSTPTLTVESLKNTIIDPENVAIYLTALLSSFTIIRTSINDIKAEFNGQLSFKAALIYGTFTFINLASRTLATFLFFTPSLGLIGSLYHGKMGQMTFLLSNSYERNIRVIDIWKMAQISDFIYITPQGYFSIFLILVVLQIWIMYNIIHKKYGKVDSFGYALDTITSTSHKRISSLVIFTFGNLVLTFPLWILSHNISK